MIDSTAGECASESEALEKLLTEHVLPNSARDPLKSDEFRREQLHTEGVDLVFKHHLEDLKLVFNSYAGRHLTQKLSKTVKWMTYADFQLLLTTCGLRTEDGAEEETGVDADTGQGPDAMTVLTSSVYVAHNNCNNIMDKGHRPEVASN